MPEKLRRNVGKFFKTRREFLKNLSMFRLHLSKFESINNLKMVNLFQDKTRNLQNKN